ncbi:hypothetical protein CAAN1_19S00628 [[Candida] anglica]|uniref:Uncharacterized protein n=1 Tax=[Candida] anglica TaxID=148631 RepID=A0ABP0E744_9ASCO
MDMDTPKYAPPKSTRLFDQSTLPDMKNYVHVQQNRQIQLNSQSSSVNYNPYSYPQQKAKSNLPVDFFHLQNKITVADQSPQFPHDSRAIPVFELTQEQFSNPIKFIESISEIGKQYGAVKIIPPSNMGKSAVVNGTSGTSGANGIGSNSHTGPVGGSHGGAAAETDSSFKSNFQINADLFWFQTNRLLNSPEGDELENRLKFHQDLIRFHSRQIREGERDTSKGGEGRKDTPPVDNEVDMNENEPENEPEMKKEPSGDTIGCRSEDVENSHVANLTSEPVTATPSIESKEVEGSIIEGVINDVGKSGDKEVSTEKQNISQDDEKARTDELKNESERKDEIIDIKGEPIDSKIEDVDMVDSKDGNEKVDRIEKVFTDYMSSGLISRASEPIEGSTSSIQPTPTESIDTSGPTTSTDSTSVIDPTVATVSTTAPIESVDSITTASSADAKTSPIVPTPSSTDSKTTNSTVSDSTVTTTTTGTTESITTTPTELMETEPVEAEHSPSIETPSTPTKLPSFLNKLPMIDKRPLDLYKLFRSVLMRGGFIEVINKKLWAQIGRELGYRGKIMTSLSSSLKSSYMKILYPYEIYLTRKRADEVGKTSPSEVPTMKRTSSGPLIIGSPKTFKRSVRLKSDKGFLLNSPHLTDVKQPNTLVSRPDEAATSASTVSNATTPTSEDGPKRKKTKTSAPSSDQTVPITPKSQLALSLEALAENPGLQDASQITSNGRFSSVYTLRQFMEKDLKFQEFLIQRNAYNFNKIHFSSSVPPSPGANSQGNAATDSGSSTPPSKFTYYVPRDGLEKEKFPQHSTLSMEKNVIRMDKLEEMYWTFVANGEEYEMEMLKDGLELENGVSLPSGVNGSGFVRLGDDLSNYKYVLANSGASATSTSNGGPSSTAVSSSSSGTSPGSAPGPGPTGVATGSTNSTGTSSSNSSTNGSNTASAGSYYNSTDYCARIIRSSLNPWNLHNLPILPNSLLGALSESDVNNQDLYTPTLNIGMTFSTENWRVEDHFTQLCNYQFFGGCKKWYFVPESEFDKFEELVKRRNVHESRIHVNNSRWNYDSLMRYFTEEDGSASTRNNIETEALMSSLENMIPPYPDYNNCRLKHSNEGFQKLIDMQRSKRASPSGFVMSLNQDCLISPADLDAAGIRYTYTVQKAGEFVIKFPKSYSSCISFGLNLSEEVNFATASWLDYALDGEKWLNKQLLLPNFSTFRLLVNLAQLLETTTHHRICFDAEVYAKASEMYSNMYREEVRLRDAVRKFNVREVVVSSDEHHADSSSSFSDVDAVADDDLSNVFPSKVVLTDMETGQVMAISLLNFLEYQDQKHPVVFNRPSSALKIELQLFCSDDKLRHFDKTLRGYSVDFAKWTSSFEQTMRTNDRLPLKALKVLLSDGEKIRAATEAASRYNNISVDKDREEYSKFQGYLENLRKFVADANGFVEECQRVLSVKHQQRIRSGGSRRRSSRMDDSQSTTTTPLISAPPHQDVPEETNVLQRLVSLLDRVPTLNFACPEADQIVELQIEIENFERASRNFLSSGKKSSLQEFDDLISLGQSFGVELPTLNFLIRLRARLVWLEKFDQIVAGLEKKFNLNDLKQFYEQGAEILGESDEAKYIQVAEMIKRSVEFDQRVCRFLSFNTADTISLRELDQIVKDLDTEAGIFTYPETYERLSKLNSHKRLIAQFIDFRSGLLIEGHFKVKYQEAQQLLNAVVDSELPLNKDHIVHSLKAADMWVEELSANFKEGSFRTTRPEGTPEPTTTPSKLLLKKLEQFQLKNSFNFADSSQDSYILSSSYANISEQDVPESEKQPIYCLCREYEAGTMVGCDTCGEWYHVQCIQEANQDYEEVENYSCPLCVFYKAKKGTDSNLSIKPTLTLLEQFLDGGKRLFVQPGDLQVVDEFVTKCQAADRAMMSEVERINRDEEKSFELKMDEYRFYLRKMYGAGVLLDVSFNRVAQLMNVLETDKNNKVSTDVRPSEEKMDINAEESVSQPTGLSTLTEGMGGELVTISSSIDESAPEVSKTEVIEVINQPNLFPVIEEVVTEKPEGTITEHVQTVIESNPPVDEPPAESIPAVEAIPTTIVAIPTTVAPTVDTIPTSETTHSVNPEPQPNLTS